MSNTTFGILAITAAVIGSAATAEPQSVRILIASSDFASQEARHRLERRVASAIEQACGSYAVVEQEQWRSIDSCRAKARADVDARIAAALAGEGLRVTAR